MADRVQQLLKTEREGRLTKDERVAIGVLRAAGEFPAANPPPSRPSGRDIISQGILRSGAGTVPYDLDKGAQQAGAIAARFGPGLVPNPLIAGPLSAGGEALAQQIEGLSLIHI